VRRTIFYLLLILQLLVISAIGLQYYLIESFGKEITITVSGEDRGSFVDYKDRLTVYPDIQTIPEDTWDVDPENLSYQEKVYVLLAENEDGYYNVQKASTKKMKASEDQVVLPGKYSYQGPYNHDVDYNFEKIPKERHKHVSERKPLVLTLKVAPWGQKRIVEVEQMESSNKN